MASNLGTVFVELSLDDKIYKQKLSETLTSGQATAKGVETAWKALGIKSEESFAAQARAADNAYTIIKNSATATANDIIRAEQAKNEKLKQLNDQQFGHQTTFIEGMKKNWLGATAIIGAAMAAMYKGFNLAEQGAGYIEQMQLLDGLAKKYNTSSGAIVGSIKTVSEGMINMKTAAEVATSALAKGLSAEQVINLSKAAVTLSDVMGTTANEAFVRLSTAMETGKEKSIKLAVGVIDLKEKYGLAADKMTEVEKRQALYNIVLEKSKEIQDRTGASAMSVADKMEAFRATIEDLKIELGVALVRAGAGVVGAFQSISAASLTISSGLWKIVQAKERLQAMVTWGEAEKKHLELASQAAQNAKTDYAESLNYAEKAQNNFSLMTASTEELTRAQAKNAAAAKAEADAATGRYEREKAGDEARKKRKQEEEAATKQITETIRKSTAEVEGINQTQYEKDMLRIDSEEQKWRDLGVAEISIATWKGLEIAKVEQKFRDDQAKASKEYQRQMDDREKSIQKGAKETAAEVDKYSKEKFAAERQVYRDISKYAGEYYETELKLINEQAAAYRKKGVDEVAVAAWVAEETRKAEYKKAEYSDDFFEGVRSELKKMKTEMTSWGKAGQEVVKSFSSNAKSTMSNVFFDAYKGNLKSAGDYFESFADGMAKTFSDVLAKMATEALIQITMNFGATWTEGAKSVLGVVGKVLGYAADWLFGGSPVTGDSSGYTGSTSTTGYAEGFYSGGMVPGYAAGGNSPANDTVLARLSPGEFIVPRSAVNNETMGILEYIRKQGTLPGYSKGGSVLSYSALSSILTPIPYGYSGPAYYNDGSQYRNPLGNSNATTAQTYGPIYSMAPFPGAIKMDVRPGGYGGAIGEWITGVAENPLSLLNVQQQAENNPIIDNVPGMKALLKASEDILNEPLMSPARMVESLGLMDRDQVKEYEKWTKGTAHAIGSIYAMGGNPGNVFSASAGSATAITSDMLATTTYNSAIEAGATEIAAQAAYEAAFATAMKEAGNQAIINMVAKYASSYGGKWALGKIMSAFGGSEDGKLGISFEGMSGASGLGDMIKGLPNEMSGKYAFSARNGLDYVPYDNFLINAHKGERVQTEKEATNLAEEIAGMKDILYQVAKSTAKMAKVLTNFDYYGLPAERVLQ